MGVPQNAEHGIRLKRYKAAGRFGDVGETRIKQLGLVNVFEAYCGRRASDGCLPLCSEI